MTNAALLKGVIVPATTPFTATEEIDEKAFTAQLEWLVAQGVLGIVVGGSTGEGYALTDDEFVRLVDLAIEVAGPTLPVLAGIIADSTQAAVRRSRLVVGRRLAALQVAPPHYIFAPSEEGMIGFYRSLAEATPFPLLIYNVIPWATVSPRQAGEIMRAVPGVVAIKQSGTDFGTYADLVRTVGAHRVFAAIDAALISCYELGASGSIAAIATATPRSSVRLWHAVAAGQREEAMALHRALLEVWIALAGPNLPAKVKAAQELQGVPASYPRAPMAPASSLERKRIANALAGLK